MARGHILPNMSEKTTDALPPLSWTIETIRLGDIIPNPNNPKTSDEGTRERLRDSVDTLGVFETLAIDADGKSSLDGHQRLSEWLTHKGPDFVVDVKRANRPLTDEEKKKLILYSGSGTQGQWDRALLLSGFEPDELRDFGAFDLSDFDVKVLTKPKKTTDPDAVPKIEGQTITQRGDVWVLGAHRVMCGDSTSPDDMARLVGDDVVELLHADPPYGMGKQIDGVQNDNLYNAKLDKFQWSWWETCRAFMRENASAYIWGNPEPLWRLWFTRLQPSEELICVRNHITWDKKSIPGMKSDLMTGYPIASEHCLFIQLGQQFTGNINTDDFPEEWAPFHKYMAEQAEKLKITPKQVHEITGVQMFGHWFTRSQFTLIPEKHHNALKDHFGGFPTPYEELKAEWIIARQVVSDNHNDNIKRIRSYFDNGHEIMRDVWEYARVFGEDRHGHATPKPVDMMARIMKSSLAKDALCLEPFGGSGSTMMAGEVTARRVYSMELSPQYVDVMVRRWQDFTGRAALLESTGQKFAERAGKVATVAKAVDETPKPDIPQEPPPAKRAGEKVAAQKPAKGSK